MANDNGKKRFKCLAYDQRVLGSKPTRCILLCPWESAVRCLYGTLPRIKQIAASRFQLCPWEKHLTALSPLVGLSKQFKISVIPS